MEGAGGGGDSKELERREKRLVKSRPEVQFLGVSFGLSIHCTHEYSVFQTKAPFFFQFSWVGHFKNQWEEIMKVALGVFLLQDCPDS